MFDYFRETLKPLEQARLLVFLYGISVICFTAVLCTLIAR